MNENIDKPTMKLPPLKRICMTIGQLPASYVETMSYYEMLVWFVHYLRDEVIPVVNANGEAVEELQELYIQLQEYVNNYFDSQDWQEMVNNKLDEMLEDGVLEQIIEQYLQSTALWTFNNVEEMQAATNLIAGSFTKTLGYYAANDGGGATYKIVDTIPSGSHYETIGDSLYAQLILDNPKKFNVLQLGFLNDGTTNNDTKMTHLLTLINDGIEIYFPGGTYLFNTPITINFNITLSGVNLGMYKAESSSSVLKFNPASDTLNFITAGAMGRQLYFKNLIFEAQNTYNLTYNRANILTNNTEAGILTETITKDNITAIDLSATTNHSINNVQFKNFSGYGLKGLRYSNVRNVRFYKCKYGFACTSDNNIMNCIFDTCKFIGNVNGALNTITNIRGDSLIHGVIIYGNGNIFDDWKIDWCYNYAFYVTTSNNFINNLQGRIGCKIYGKDAGTSGGYPDEAECAVVLKSDSTSNYVNMVVNDFNVIDGDSEHKAKQVGVFSQSAHDSNNINFTSDVELTSNYSFKRLYYCQSAQDKTISINNKMYYLTNYSNYPAAAVIKIPTLETISY